MNILRAWVGHRRRHSTGLLSPGACLAFALGLGLAPVASQAAGTYYVDNSGATPCSNAGPGTEDQPFCTIGAAVAKVGGPGTTIIVKPGIYPEMITVPVSGDPGNPLVIQAMEGATIDGADNFEKEELWTQYSGDVWLTPISWSPVQVFVNGALLIPATGDPALLAPNSFCYVFGQGLYVNAGGGNPGDKGIRVGHRMNGFHINGKSWITIQGFIIMGCDEKGIELEGGASNCVIHGNGVEQCASSGISLYACADIVIDGNNCSRNAFHGIELRGGSTGCQITNNGASYNMDRFSNVATGIYLNGSPDNRLQNNKVFDNGDTGIEIQGGSDNCVSVQNVSFENHDHGFFYLSTVGTINVGNVAWMNRTDGIAIEGSSQNTSVFDCISVDNGLPVNGFDFLADSSSVAGMQSDYNLFWNSTSQKPIRWNGVQYATVAAYSGASGLDANTLQADPLFYDAPDGLFHLKDGSPAIDSGTSAVPEWPATDAQGLPREDDPAVPNTGAGACPYTDRGAFEHRVSAVGVAPLPGVSAIALSQAFPNPARGAVAFTVDLPRAGRIEWGVFDVGGRRLGGGASWQPAGRSQVSWTEPKTAGAGVRFARFTVLGRTIERRFVSIR